MKILIIVNSLSYGGTEKQVVVDANMLIDRGHHVTVAYNKEGDLINLLVKGINKYPIKSKNFALALLQIFFHLLFNKYDVVHSHMFWGEKISALPAKLTGHRIVFNEHGLGLWRRWYHILIMRFISLFADKIITSCDATKNVKIEREKLNRKKIITIYNSLNKISEDTKKVDIPYFLKNKKHFIIGFVGRFKSVKRLSVFVDIADRLRKVISNFKIVLVGDGEEKKRIKRGIENKNLENYFYIPGAVLNIDQYYKTFDVFVLPSIREACSVALLEAGASGVPAIAFDVGGNPEIIQDGTTGFIISNNDISILTKKIIYLYKNNHKRYEMGLAAKNYIKNTFSVSKRLDKLTSLYKEKC